MKPFIFCLVAALGAVSATARADTLVFWSGGSSGDNPQESISYAATGVQWVPGSVGATGVVTPGMPFATLTIGDLNGDGFPDIIGMIQGAMQGTAQPMNVHVADISSTGSIVWSVELDQALVYKVSFPSTLTVRKAGGGGDHVTCTFVSPLPMQGTMGEYHHRDVPTVDDITVSIPAVQDPPGVTEVSAVGMTFPAALASPNPVGGSADREGSEPSVSEIALSSPSGIDDGYQEWMNSVIQNGSDVRLGTLIYTFADGSTITLPLNLELDKLDYSTTAIKDGGAVAHISINHTLRAT